MANSDDGLQLCPTRVDGAAVLFAHKVDACQCQDRQRGHYHKCFTCIYNNAFVVKNGRPKLPAPMQATKSEAKVG